MTKKMKIALVAGVLCLLVCLSIVAVSCSNRESEPSQIVNPDEKVTYTIEIRTEGGMALEGVGVYIYTDETQSELVWFAKADAAGRVTFTDVRSDSYIAVLRDVPEGYLVEETYPITGEITEIVLATELAEGDLSNTLYELGDVIHDFSVTTPDGTVYTLSELLEEKDAVVLNFWYLQCQPCRAEFPYLQEAYEKYSDRIEVLALNPVNADDEEIAAFQKELGLTFPMAQCDADWERLMQLTAYPTTVVIDRYGTISLIHKGTVTEAETFESMFEFFTSDTYQQTLVEDLESLEEVAEKAQLGSAGEPIEIGGIKSFTVTVPAGQVAYYNVYKVSGMYMQIKSDNVYVVYNGKTYTPSGGAVGMTVTSDSTFNPVYLQIGNSGTETETFKVTFSTSAGTYGNPYTASLGTFTTKVKAGNDQGVYYTYKATQEGYLVLENISATSGINYDYVLYNLDSMAYRNLGEDGTIGAESGKSMVTVKVKKGQTVQIIIGTLPDSSNSYPAGTFTSKLYFTDQLDGIVEEEVVMVTYAVTVTDPDRAPVSGVLVNIEGENGQSTVSTDSSGVASVSLKAGTYTASLSVPIGYKANTTKFKLTEKVPIMSVKLDPLVIAYETYTVKVVDEAGNPMPNVLVSIVGNSYAYTDANGVAGFTLPKDTYTVIISVPDGYVSEAASFTFEEGSTELNISLKAGSGQPDTPDDSKITYSVTVVDYLGKPIENTMVTIGTAMAQVDSTGTASVKLEPGSYNVTLSFKGTTKRYYDSVTLTADAPSATIRVANGVSGETGNIYGSPRYYVYEGGTYLELPNEDNYFLFKPAQAGVYRFTVSTPGALLQYWGSNFAFLQNQTSNTDWENNSFTLEFLASSVGEEDGTTCILGITGAENCILEITRIGDAKAEIESIEWLGYDDVPAPSKQTVSGVSGKTLTYVNVQGAADDYKLYKDSTGIYHFDSVSGPVAYINLGTNAPYVSMSQLLGIGLSTGTGFKGPIYYVDEKPYREDYTVLITAYAECIDSTYGLYPLNDELIYMIQQGGESMGWWDSTNGNYRFEDVANLNTEIAWMFAVCWFE